MLGPAATARAETLVCNVKTYVVNVFSAPLDGVEPKSETAPALRRRLAGEPDPFDIVDTLRGGSRVKVVGPSDKDERWMQIVFRHSKTGMLTLGFVHRTRLFTTACTPPTGDGETDEEYFAPEPDEPRLNSLGRSRKSDLDYRPEGAATPKK